MLTVLDLFSGIGGFSLGLERTGGFETVAFCEIEDYPRKVLAKHWPNVPIHDDVRTLNGKQYRGAVDVVCGGFPCQDLSVAGKQGGITADRSGLWSEMCRIISEARPCYAIVENVTSLLSGQRGSWFSRVLGDLAAIGYDCEWHCIPASYVGRPHIRDRVWIIAYHREKRGEGCITESLQRQLPLQRGENGRGLASWRERSDLYAPQLCRVGDGIPNLVDRLAGCGNAVVPQIPELIGRAILESEAA